jgi:glycosyltransferase involved in cell wall biosynthesis
MNSRKLKERLGGGNSDEQDSKNTCARTSGGAKMTTDREGEVVASRVSPVLSIVTITRNNLNGLARTLRSIESQRAEPSLYEVIVIDGDSSDGTREYLVANPQRNTTWISERDRGVYDAMNKGSSKAGGKYQLFLNAGDTFHGLEALDRILRATGEDPAWIVGRAINLSDPHQPIVIANVPHNWLRHAMGRQPHCHQSTIFSTRLVTALGGYSEAFGIVGDFDFILRAGVVSRPLIIPEVIAEYEGNGMSAKLGQRIPEMQRIVRASRLGETGLSAFLDKSYVRILGLKRGLSRHVDRYRD